MIISVDQGFANYGYSVWDSNLPVSVGVIQTKRTKDRKIRVSEDMIKRHSTIASALNALIVKHKPQALVGEMPGFGAQSSAAAVAMTMASSITLTLCNTHKIPTIWHTPREIKEHFTGNPDASKEDMMLEACKRHNWKITYKTIKFRISGKVARRDPIYHVMGKQLPKAKFEHIADSIAAYYTAKYFHEKEK